MYETDFVMKMIKDISRALAKILFNKDSQTLMEEQLEKYQSGDEDNNLFLLADDGRIEDAENILSEMMETEDVDELALAFYEYINMFDDNFLIEHNFSRDEIKLGIENIVRKRGLENLLVQL